MKKVSVDAGVLDVKFYSQNMDIVFLLDNEKYLQVLQAEDMYSKRVSIFFDQCHTFFKGKLFTSGWQNASSSVLRNVCTT